MTFAFYFLYNIFGDFKLKSIDKIYTKVEIVKNSKFISLLMPISSKGEIKDKLKEIKKNYPKANHYCYAYILDSEHGMSDDGEPSKTAGAPLHAILEGNNLMSVLVVVVRYFGGIKLGPGGLIRAYSHGLQNILGEANFFEMVNGYLIQISFPFSLENKVCHLLSSCTIKSKTYDVMCHYVLEASKEVINSIESFVTIEEKKQILIRKID